MPRHDPRLADLTPEDAEYEYWLYYYAEHPPAPASDPLTDAWMAAVSSGQLNPNDPAAVAQWQQQQGLAPAAPEAPAWEPVAMPSREGAPDG